LRDWLEEAGVEIGKGDKGIQSYCFRLIATDKSDNMVPWTNMNYFIFIFPSFFSLLILSSYIQVNPFGRPEKTGVNYYISNDGHDENPGTIDEPWRTISKVNAINFTRGDSILFEGDHLFKGSIRLNDQDAATAEYPVTISSYGKGRAIIDGGDSVFDYAIQCFI
jgi:hypothetical protein